MSMKIGMIFKYILRTWSLLTWFLTFSLASQLNVLQETESGVEEDLSNDVLKHMWKALTKRKEKKQDHDGMTDLDDQSYAELLKKAVPVSGLADHTLNRDDMSLYRKEKTRYGDNTKKITGTNLLHKLPFIHSKVLHHHGIKFPLIKVDRKSRVMRGGDANEGKDDRLPMKWFRDVFLKKMLSKRRCKRCKLLHPPSSSFHHAAAITDHEKRKRMLVTCPHDCYALFERCQTSPQVTTWHAHNQCLKSKNTCFENCAVTY